MHLVSLHSQVSKICEGQQAEVLSYEELEAIDLFARQRLWCSFGIERYAAHDFAELPRTIILDKESNCYYIVLKKDPAEANGTVNPIRGNSKKRRRVLRVDVGLNRVTQKAGMKVFNGIDAAEAEDKWARQFLQGSHTMGSAHLFVTYQGKIAGTSCLSSEEPVYDEPVIDKSAVLSSPPASPKTSESGGEYGSLAPVGESVPLPTKPQNRAIIIQDWMETDLRRHIRANPNISNFTLLNYTRQALLGIDSVHAFGCAHRDAKLDNLFLDSEGVVRLGDFGCTIKADDIGVPGGCRNYFRPGVAEGQRPQVHQDDFYALGKGFQDILQELGRGKPSLPSSPLRSTWPRSRGMQDIVDLGALYKVTDYLMSEQVRAAPSIRTVTQAGQMIAQAIWNRSREPSEIVA